MEPQKSIQALVEKIDGKLIAVASSETQDRMGDVLKADGWDLKNFKRNPVLLFAHRYNEPPIGTAKKIRVEGKRLIFEPVFHTITQLAREVKAMYESEPPVMSGFSVGFIAKKIDEVNPHFISEMELLEISAVPVPAHQEALLVAQKGITDAEKKEVEKWIGEEKECLECEEKKEENSINFEESDFITDIKPYPNEHACRLEDPGKYDSFARKNCYVKHAGKCIDFIFGIVGGKSELQAMRYLKDTWSAGDASAHCKDKGGSFEAAKEIEEIKEELEKSNLEKEFEDLKEEITQIKAGRILSGKNRDLISDAISSMKQAISTLRSLLQATEPAMPADGGEGKSQKGRKEVAQKPLKNKDVVVRALRRIANEASVTLSKVKK